MSCFYHSGEYEKALAWRRVAYEELVHYGFKVFDPTYNSEEHFKYPKELDDGFIMQNYTYLKKCDFILVNLEMINDSVGSVWELSMAWTNKIPVIAFGECEAWKDRPHLKSMIDVKFDKFSSAIDYIKNMYRQGEGGIK